jgi:hypothetical protein
MPETDAIENEAATLGIKESKVKMATYKEKDPVKIEKEETRHRKLIKKRTANRIDKAKVAAKMKPIDKRKALLIGRFKAIRAKTRTYTYSNKNVEAWTEELNMIKNNPKGWKQVTENGTIPFAPGNKTKKTAKQLLDNMDLDS